MSDLTPPSLLLPADVYAQILTHCLDGFPIEACGLLVGSPANESTDGTSRVFRFVPSDNLAASALVYTIDPRVHLRAERDADDDGLAVLGVVHSHTHTDPYPSPTDVAQAPDPSWHYVIVSLRDAAPSLRSYRISDATVTEERVGVLRPPPV
jgi:[CysO sulfur-carrier protein]-S-L-cysteine hydrolase